MTLSVFDINNVALEEGSHRRRINGVCLLEAVAWYAGENHTDLPECVSPVLRRYGMELNDRITYEQRQLLKQFIPGLVGTAQDGLDSARYDFMAQTFLAQW